jgi:membrane-associated phospholipid phosphatase
MHNFDAQVAYLNAANEHYPVLILSAERFVLDAQIHADHGLGAGISAMPSMHVAMALLFALAIAPVSKLAKIGGYTFFATIQVATVHLAAHYAVDGYVSIVVTLSLWMAVKPLARSVARCSRFGATAAAAASPEPASAY